MITQKHELKSEKQVDFKNKTKAAKYLQMFSATLRVLLRTNDNNYLGTMLKFNMVKYMYKVSFILIKC